MVDFEFYRSAYLGEAIPEKKFAGIARQAQAVLQRFQRIYRVRSPGDEEEKMAVCAMAETLYEAEKRGTGVIASSVGSVSVRYSPSEGSRLWNALYGKASIYLDIYRGRGK